MLKTNPTCRGTLTLFSKLILSLVLLGLAQSVFSQTNRSQSNGPTISKERMIFSTTYGDLVFAFYPEIAPNHVAHIKNLVNLKLYDSLTFTRIISNFIIQTGSIPAGDSKYSAEQSAALVPINAEFDVSVKHTKGVISMAHYDGKPNSGVSSFSILLNDAPHLDGNYTIFGVLESGGSVVNSLLGTPRNGAVPAKILSINKAYIVEDKNQYYRDHPFDPLAEFTSVNRQVSEEKNVAEETPQSEKILSLVAILVAAIVVICLLIIAFFQKLEQKHILSLLLGIVLVCGFILILAIVPYSANSAWLSISLFVGIFFLFRLMSSFEK